MRSLLTIFKFAVVTFMLLVTDVISLYASSNFIRFQGRLTDTEGRPILGSPQVSFEIYDAAAGGTKLWGPTPFQNVNANDAGLFSTDIGPFNSPLIFSVSPNLFLQVTIKAGTAQTNQVLSPRQELSNVPYAFYSQVSASATVAGSVPDGSISRIKIQDDAVDSSKIENHSVVTLKLATGAVTSSVVADGSLTGFDLENETITPDKMNVSSFTTAGWIIPQGAIFMFLGGCPAGYDEVTELRNRVPMGADIGNTDPDVPNSTGQQLGSKSHIHGIGHTHEISVQQNYSAEQDISTGEDIVWFSNPKLISAVGAFGKGDLVWLRGLDHSHETVSQIPNQSASTTALPPALTAIFCRKQ